MLEELCNELHFTTMDVTDFALICHIKKKKTYL